MLSVKLTVTVDDGVCSGNVCVECADDGDCLDGVCSGNVCVECADDGDCLDGVCSGNVCVECADDGDCLDGVCSGNMCVECADDGDCLDGVCSGNVCVECADDGDCLDGVCSGNVCVVAGSVLIDKFTVKAGKKDKGDSIKFSGLLDTTPDDFNAAMGGNVVVTIESDDTPDRDAIIFTFSINEDSFKNGKYKSPKVKPVDKGDPVTSLKIDSIKGKMKFIGKNLDLTGLSCPITLVVRIGNYVAEIVLNEDIVNGPKKPCPAELMVGI